MFQAVKSSLSFIRKLILWHLGEDCVLVFRQVNPSPGAGSVSGNIITYTGSITRQKDKRVWISTISSNLFICLFIFGITDLLSVPLIFQTSLLLSSVFAGTNCISATITKQSISISCVGSFFWSGLFFTIYAIYVYWKICIIAC